MESRLRVQGHPIQPMLVTFAFGLFVSAAVFDLADVAGGPAFLGEVGYWSAVAALVAAALTTVAGWSTCGTSGPTGPAVPRSPSTWSTPRWRGCSCSPA
ncbi:DUF2231 domain-containing protein [Micromonospora sp. ATA51]|uniref:DUF2231 domain-containing protein n=1 Tax=Micromonospora sp. ATA51 TaxID=2806098 RepID=UPI0028157309|nr:DUF2231 domain-containing protein [Micromonospora sp. ATA51]